MKKKHARHERKVHSKTRHKPPQVTSDRAIYAGVILIGFFFTAIVWLLMDAHWREPVILYVAGVAYFIVLAAFAIYRGKHIPNWQQAMAKIPLRFVGYGTKNGKPLEAAHGQDNTRNAVLVSMIVALVVVGGLVAILRPFIGM
jgi:hypothetical protein